MKNLILILVSACVGFAIAWNVHSHRHKNDVHNLELMWKSSELELLISLIKEDEERRICKTILFARQTKFGLDGAASEKLKGGLASMAQDHVSRTLSAYSDAGIEALVNQCLSKHEKT